jgi:hypothetical protein
LKKKKLKQKIKMQISIGLNKKDLKLSQGTSSSRTTKTNFLPDIKKKKYYNNGPG